jgi:hypothetical protein
MLKGAQRKYKTRYRVTNWRDYNEFLSKRAALSIWILRSSAKCNVSSECQSDILSSL